MKLPEIKRREAELRLVERRKLSNKQQLAKLDRMGVAAKRERDRLT